MIECNKVSIIVPVYNTELFLELCLNNLENQSYRNIEILLIDDGSNDKSSDICLKFEKKDSRFKYYRQKNQGQSAARNQGLNLATGKYVVFCDSDDMVSKYYIENLLNAVLTQKCDIGISKFREISENTRFVSNMKSEKYQKFSAKEGIRRILYQRKGIDLAPWGKIFLLSLFEDVRFPVGKIHEDVATIYLPLLKSNEIVIVDSVDYFYRENTNSTVHNRFSIKKLDCIYFAEKMYNDIVNVYPELESACACRYISAVCNIYKQIPKNEFEDDREECWKKILKCRWLVLKDLNSRIKTRLAVCCTLFGKKFFEIIIRKVL